MGEKKTEGLEIRVPSASLAVAAASCPNGCDLMAADMPIHGRPSIGIDFSFGDWKGRIYLDPMYGSFDNICDIEIQDGQEVDFRCPKCGVSLRDEKDLCPTCSARMFVLHLPGGGILEGCLRKGCSAHRLRIVDVDAQLLRVFKERVGLPGIDV
ncbi:MAG: hypothetical protein FJY73_12000 [Candidatus Eisenbacteria bacterium]|nr:hypothetical protein [Candidatus Eisenbacteria bacterium]